MTGWVGGWDEWRSVGVCCWPLRKWRFLCVTRGIARLLLSAEGLAELKWRGSSHSHSERAVNCSQLLNVWEQVSE